MNFKKIIPAILAAAIVPGIVLAAETYGQAGDIAAGGSYWLTKGEVASYYKDGKKGYVTFSCRLEGDGHLAATLFAGKNFTGNLPKPLKNGYNGPFTWKLRNLGENNGNIKVKLVVGNNAVLQCKEFGPFEPA